MVKVLFFGTPDIAVPYLHWLSQHSLVVGVVCRPDEPVGRGMTLTPPPTKVFAVKKGIPVFQPAGPWTAGTVGALKNLNADLGIAVAYGRILPKEVLAAPRLGCVNVHFSLLPKYRGAAPMQWALINGETKTGATVFWLEEGLDSGRIFHQADVPISPDDDATRLEAKLVPLGLRVLQNVMADIEKGEIKRTPQAGSPTLAPILKKEHGKIDWNKPASYIVNLVRGLSVWPGVATRFTGRDGVSKQLKVTRARVMNEDSGEAPGAIIEALKNEGILVQTGNKSLLLMDVQPEGKKAMAAWAFWQGSGLKVGDKLS